MIRHPGLFPSICGSDSCCSDGSFRSGAGCNAGEPLPGRSSADGLSLPIGASQPFRSPSEGVITQPAWDTPTRSLEPATPANTSRSSRLTRRHKIFIRDLQDQQITVHYNPNSPGSSTLLASDIDVVLQHRAPSPEGESPLPAESIPDWLRPFIWIFIALSALGLVVSVWVHLARSDG